MERSESNKDNWILFHRSSLTYLWYYRMMWNGISFSHCLNLKITNFFDPSYYVQVNVLCCYYCAGAGIDIKPQSIYAVLILKFYLSYSLRDFVPVTHRRSMTQFLFHFYIFLHTLLPKHVTQMFQLLPVYAIARPSVGDSFV